MPWLPSCMTRLTSASASKVPTICGSTTQRHFSQSFNLLGTYHNIASVLHVPTSVGDSSRRLTPREVEITGHVRTIRNQKRRSFVEIGDGSTTATLQALLEPAQATGLGTGTSVRIAGLWRPSPAGKGQSHELHARDVEILGHTDADVYPLQKKYHSSDFLRTMPHLRLRVPSNALLSRLRSDCDHYISSHFRTNEFVRAYPPIITSSDCEGAGEVFTVQPRQGHVVGVPTTDRLDATASAPHESGMKSSEPEYFFREQKYLTVSSQLHLEAYVHEHQKVWTLSPTFRAEKSDTPRHLSEFYMLEAEERSESLHQIMDTVEGLIRSVATNVEGSMAGRELLQPVHATSDPEQQEMQQKRAALIKNRWQGLKKSYWPRVPYATAVKLLQAAESEGEVSFHHKPEWATGLQLEHEKFLAAEIGLGSPVFITDYPAAVKPFYMLPSQGQDESTPAEQRTVACFDLLLPDLCEVVGGSLREHRLGALQASMSKHGISNMDWYLDLRRFGSVPHGGFGLGFDRLMCYLSGVDNVRDVVPWPRYYGRCDG